MAWFDGERLVSVSLDGSDPILPTAVHLDRQYQSLVGSAAIVRYVEENRGRRVELVAQLIGEAASSVVGNEGGEDISRLSTQRGAIYGPPVDRTLPGRLFLGLKRLLGDPGIERLQVFERQYRLVALLTPILQHVRERLEAGLLAPLPPIHVGRPVVFEGRHPDRNAIASGRLAEALDHAGLQIAQFGSEPVAATLSWLWRARPERGGLALTVDFGGGTLDLSLIRYDGARFEVLSTTGLALGGDRIDQMIFEHMLFPQLGQGERWVRPVDGREVDTLFPFEEFESGLLNWQTTHLLNQNRTRAMVVDRLSRGGAAAPKFRRLLDLVDYSCSYNCFAAIRQAKAQLSTVAETVIDIPELNLRLPFAREQLDAVIAPVLVRLAGAMDHVLANAGCPAQDVDVVIRTGGTSEIVAVRRLLEERFAGRVVGHDPFTSVAGGLAIANFSGIRLGDVGAQGASAHASSPAHP